MLHVCGVIVLRFGADGTHGATFFAIFTRKIFLPNHCDDSGTRHLQASVTLPAFQRQQQKRRPSSRAGIKGVRHSSPWRYPGNKHASAYRKCMKHV